MLFRSSSLLINPKVDSEYYTSCNLILITVALFCNTVNISREIYTILRELLIYLNTPNVLILPEKFDTLKVYLLNSIPLLSVKSTDILVNPSRLLSLTTPNRKETTIT